MTLFGFQQAKSNSCLYYHAEKQIRIEVHGDDFTGVGPKADTGRSMFEVFWEPHL